MIADGGTDIIACDFGNRNFTGSYESWDIPGVETLSGGTLPFAPLP